MRSKCHEASVRQACARVWGAGHTVGFSPKALSSSFLASTQMGQRQTDRVEDLECSIM